MPHIAYHVDVAAGQLVFSRRDGFEENKAMQVNLNFIQHVNFRFLMSKSHQTDDFRFIHAMDSGNGRN